MIINYVKTAVRNLYKNKVFSLINIAGLAMGLGCSLLIMLWVRDESRVDRFHRNGDRLYSLYETQHRDAVANAFFGGPGILADELKRVLPDVEYATNYAWNELATFRSNDKIIKESGNHAGADFFRMFSFPLLAGSAATALQSPSDIAISRKMADEFFGSPAQALGKTLRYQNYADFRVSAVFDNLPENSTLQFDYLLPWQQFLEGNSWAKEWSNNGPSCFVMLRRGASAPAFRQKIYRFLDTYNKDQTPRSYIRLGMERYGDVYLHGDFDKEGNISGGRIEYVHLFSAVALFILLIACINFMNLTTAGSIQRAREIGVRKVVGAARWAIIRQFMGEAFFVVTIAVILALLFTDLLLPQFNQLTGKQIRIPVGEPGFWAAIAVLVAATGIISGSYPALYLSAFRPVRVLKGLPKFSGSAQWFRKGLVVFQFMLSIILIIGTVVVRRQVDYIQTMNLGYDRENLIYVPLEGTLLSKYEVFKTAALQLPGVSEVSRITDNPTRIENGTGGVSWTGKDPNADIEFAQTAVGYDFARTMRLKFAEGRDFSRDFATDSTGYIINESALKVIGYKNPVGKPLTFWQKPGTIIGVLKDFHFNSVQTPIVPIVLRLGEDISWGQALVRTRPGKTREALAGLEKVCKSLNPQFPFTYQFSDEEYAKMYRNEQVVSRLADYFAFLAIFISCLGLLGLVMFASQQRTREFGIRKVLGATPATLFGLLSREFLFLVLLALVIAFPVAWLAMSHWLESYVYAIHLSAWMFVFAGFLIMAIALLTVSFQAIRAALANPMKSLRTE